MREFYRLESISFDDTKFAFCDIPDDTQTADFCPTCPECRAAIGSRQWLEPRRVILSKPKYGDFVSGLRFLVSERVKAAYKQSVLKGIKAFVPVEVAKVRYLRKTSPLPPQYYALDLTYSFARIDNEKSLVKWYEPEPEKICPLCNPCGAIKKEVNGIYIDDTNWEGEDIFHLHETGSIVYASQKFVDFCLECEFTNFRYINTKDYVYPTHFV